MSDPRYSDQHYSNSQLSDPVGRYDSNIGGVWGWVAGILVVALIAFFLIAGGHSINNASNSPAAPGATTPMRNVTPQGTTGMGSPQQFHTPAPPATGGQK
jgi:hypothetical protein